MENKDGKAPKSKSKLRKLWVNHPIFTSFSIGVISNLIVITGIGVLAISEHYTYLVDELPKKVNKIDTSVTNLIAQYQFSESKGGFKPIKVGVIFNREKTLPIRKEEVTLVETNNCQFDNIDNQRGKYIILRSNMHGMTVITKLFIARVSRNEKDIDKDVELFLNEETAKILTPNINVGKFNFEYKITNDNEK